MNLLTMRTAILLTAISWAVMPATASILNFNSVGPTGNGMQSGAITVGDFNFTSPSFHIIDDPASCAGGCIDFGSESLAYLGPNFDSPVTITAVGGGTFSFASLDAARLFLTPGGIGSFTNAATVNLAGTLQGGVTVNQALTLGTEGVISTFALSGFTNLSSVTLSGTYNGSDASFGVDNLNLSLATATPEPSSLGLLFGGISIFGLGLRFRSRRLG